MPSALLLIDRIACLFAGAYMLAKSRIATSASPIARLLAQKDHEATKSRLLDRELDVLRAQRAAMHPHKRPDYGREQRLEILLLMRLRGWNATQAANRFVLHPNTVRAWIREAQDGGERRLSVPWNRYHDAVRWVITEIRRLCPEPEFGTRQIARHLVRAGIQVSRSTVQRVLHGSARTRPPLIRPMGLRPTGLLAPKRVSQTWHVDLTTAHAAWLSFHVIAIQDGYSRMLLSLYAFPRHPAAKDVVKAFTQCARLYGKPGAVICDNGSQFRSRFVRAMKWIGVRVVHSRVRKPSTNGKIERLFRTFKRWWRTALLPWGWPSINMQLEDYRHWFNTHRPHAAARVDERRLRRGAIRNCQSHCRFLHVTLSCRRSIFDGSTTEAIPPCPWSIFICRRRHD